MSRKGPVFQDHHAIEQQTLERSPLPKAIAEAGHFDIHAPENRIFLPADPALAQTLGITSHSGDPGRIYPTWPIQAIAHPGHASRAD